MSEVARAYSWKMETLLTATVGIEALGVVDVDVTTEQPVDEHGANLPRRGNRWYPTLIGVTSSDATMHPQQARELAHVLLKAADLCEATDTPDEDVCGHWHPCGCGQAKP